MATEQPQDTQDDSQNENLNTGLALLAGLGVAVMLVAAGIGVVLPDADNGVVGLMILIGAALLITGLAGWIVAARPHQNFDDISVPMYHGHNEHDDH